MVDHFDAVAAVADDMDVELNIWVSVAGCQGAYNCTSVSVLCQNELQKLNPP